MQSQQLIGIKGQFQMMTEIDPLAGESKDACASCSNTECSNNPDHKEWVPVNLTKGGDA